MQLQRIELKKLGITERSLRSDTQGNFDELENTVNSNAGATEAWYKQLSSSLAAETANRQAADTAEANERKVGDDSEARDRRAADEELEQELRSEMAAGDKNLQSQIDDKASIEDLNDAKAEWLARAKHIALGTDLETVEAAVVMVLHKRGVI